MDPALLGDGPASRTVVLLTGLLLLAPAFSGCLGAIDDSVADGRLSLGSSDGDVADDEGRLRVFVQSIDAGSYASASSSVADPVAAPAAGSNASLAAADGHVDLTSQDPVEVADGGVGPGTVDAVAFTLTDVHGTYDGSSFEVGDLDLRIEVVTGVPVETGSTTTVIVGVDLAATGSPETGFEPGVRLLGARQDGEALDVGEAAGPPGEPPVARAEIFNGTGVKVYESNFEAAGGETEAVAKHEEITFTARPSTDPDGSVEAFRWSFSDGASAQGKTVTHAYGTGGIHEATLTVTDDRGVEDSITFQLPVRYLVGEDGEDLFTGNASGSFAAGGDDLVTGPAQEETRASHTFEIPDIERSPASSDDGSGDDGTDEDASGPSDDGSWDLPVHGGGHGAGDVDDPDSARRLAAVTVDLTWTGDQDAYTLQVSRDGDTLAQGSGDTGNITLELSQVDGWYTDGGNYTVQVQYDQGVDGSYDVEVTGTYIPIPTE